MITSTRASLLFALCVVSLVSAGCASSGVGKGTSTATDADQVLLERGNQALKEQKWTSSRQYFTKLLDSYPQSTLRAEAKLGVGDTYLGEGTSASFVFALNEYREFIAFYPTSPRADYAQFQLGMVHLKQMLKAGRDQTETKEAIKEFQTFVDHYPNSTMLPEGQKRLREAKDRLADSDFGVGLFYHRIRLYQSAIDRFKTLLQADPGYTHKDALYFYLGEALEKGAVPLEPKAAAAKKAEALPYYQRLVDEFSQSQYLEEAKRRIELLKAAIPETP